MPENRRTVLRSVVSVAVLLASHGTANTGDNTSDQGGSSMHDFDFLFGQWTVEHRRLKSRLTGSTGWETFPGSCDCRPLLGGAGNVDDNVLDLPSGPYKAASVRMFDAATKLWSIWWFDSRVASLDPPVKGSFASGVGTFYADDQLRGKPIRVRYLWSRVTPTSAQWQQAFSPDGGTTWETNWYMQFTRRA